MTKKNYLPIENYGIIGDLRTAALVGIDGSIDFMCFPNFDSPSIFASTLDINKGGSFQISPVIKDFKTKQMYLPDTNILLTRFLFENGIGEITDFMPVCELFKHNILIRKVHCVKGQIKFKMTCSPRFNYTQNAHTAYLKSDHVIFEEEIEKGMVLKLHSTVPLKLKNGDAHAQFVLKAGEEAVFLLENLQNDSVPLKGKQVIDFCNLAFEKTSNYWKKWISHSTYKGRWREMVNRSALVLKLLISQKYGAIVAAPTFSFPEKIGGSKNWDYRYTWIRDASFTVYALMRIGFYDEAEAFMQWIQKICKKLKKDSPLQIMFGIDGNSDLPEYTLPFLEGYMKSIPVRIGNAAYKQCQIDIYGELMDSVYLYEKFVSPISNETWEILTEQINWLCENWRNKDHGIWEIRGPIREFLYSRFMSWVAVDRAIRLAQKRSLPFPKKWSKIRDTIYYSIFDEFWNEKRQSFVQYKGSDAVDASILLMPLIRFISPKDPKWVSTLKCIENDLVIDSLVFRYCPDQAVLFGLKSGEGTFSACSFWYVECLSRSGQLHKALYNFEKILSYAESYLKYSQEAFDAAIATYRAGTGNILNVITTQATLANARTQLIQARTQWAVSIFNIAFATGTLNPTYVKTEMGGRGCEKT